MRPINSTISVSLICCGTWFLTSGSTVDSVIISKPRSSLELIETERWSQTSSRRVFDAAAPSDSCAKPGDEFADTLRFPPTGRNCWKFIDGKYDTTFVKLDSGIARLRLDANCYDFGDIPINQNREWVLGISNCGTEPLAIQGLRVAGRFIPIGGIDTLYASEKIKLGTCMFVNEPKRFKLFVQVICSPPCESGGSLTLYATGVVPILQPDTNVVDFNTVHIGQDSTIKLTVRNIGGETLEIFDQYIDDKRQKSVFTVIDSLPAKIIPGVKDTMKIRFVPTQIKNFSDSLLIVSNSWQRDTLYITLKGTGADLKPPMIQPTSLPCTVNYRQPVPISFRVTDDLSDAIACTLHYREGGNSSFTHLPFAVGNEAVIISMIPEQVVNERGVDYYFSARDTSGNWRREPTNPSMWYSLSVQIPGGLLFRADSAGNPVYQRIGDTRQDYRLISIPLLLDIRAPAAVFSSYLGDYDDGYTWRFFDYYNGSYYELGEEGCRNFIPGRAFWLIVNKKETENKILTIGSGRTARTSEYANASCNDTAYYKIQLEPGWNLFANPFNFPVARDSIRFHSGNETQLQNQIWTYRGRGEEWRWRFDKLWPWEGYAIRSDDAHLMEIRPHDPRKSIMTKGMITAANHSNSTIEWTIQIEARSGEAVDLDNFVGVRNNAAEGWDVNDIYEPPPVGEYVTMYFPHDDWGAHAENYAGDFCPPFVEGAVWEFEVKVNLKENLTTLRFENLATVPEQFAIYLFYKNRQVLHDLRKKNHYTYDELGELLPGRFELIVGISDFVHGKISQNEEVVADFNLFPVYPNPFREQAVIHYSLPQYTHVRLEVFDLLGRRVRTLADGHQDRGMYTTVWDGKNEAGQMSASGIYFGAGQKRYHLAEKNDTTPNT
jgi:hypothetical protein